jgi:ubiquinone/menaquinone biosynthesis C-methylase UbiE
LKTEGFILDIGGGGEGIIGKLNGEQVIAIDIKEEELEETQNKALKVVMDASEVKFLPKSFHMCTAFFSLMYIPKSKHLKVFQEVYRVLIENGRFAVWDVRIPTSKRKFKEFIVPLRIKLPDEVVETGYGVKWQVQDLENFRKLAHQANFEVVNEWSSEEIFYLEMIKKG